MKKSYMEMAAQLLAPALYYSQLHQLTKPVYAGLGNILMFHRVIPESNKPRVRNHKSLEVTPESLENVILFFKRLDYQFVSLDEALKLAQQGTLKKFVVFTFDDGYEDNFTYAYPIFKKHNVPFTIYVATGLPDGTCVMWWYLLEDLLVNNSRIEFQYDARKFAFSTVTLEEKEQAFYKIRSLFFLANETGVQKLIDTLFKNRVANVLDQTKELALNWEQIKILSQDPLVTIGSHTVNHLTLDRVTYDRSRHELAESKKIIESHITSSVAHFCYPLGSYGDKEIKLLKEFGYTTAVTIKMANTFKENFDHPFSLPRIMINSLTTEKILRLQVNGLLPALRNKFRRVIT